MPFTSLNLHPTLPRPKDWLRCPTLIQAAAVPPAPEGGFAGFGHDRQRKPPRFACPSPTEAATGAPRPLVRHLRRAGCPDSGDLNDFALIRLTAAAVYGGVGTYPQGARAPKRRGWNIGTPGRLDISGPCPPSGLARIPVLTRPTHRSTWFPPDIRRVLRHIPARRQTPSSARPRRRRSRR